MNTRIETVRRMRVVKLTCDIADVLGVEPILGRHISAADDVPGAPKVILLIESICVRSSALVDAVGIVNTAPLGNHEGAFFEAEHGERDPDANGPTVLARTASPDYFRAIGMTLLSGRVPEPDEHHAPIAPVNRSFARTFWPQAALGEISRKRIRASGGARSFPWLTVVGVVDDVRHYGLDAATRAGVYTMYGRALGPAMTVVVRANGSPEALVPPIRRCTRSIRRSRYTTLRRCRIVSNTRCGCAGTERSSSRSRASQPGCRRAARRTGH